jgi:hypothetical protein
MKTKQTKIDRSAAKWLPGAMALAATTASSQAATVQITLTGNKISTVGGNDLKADLTGDGNADLAFVAQAIVGAGISGWSVAFGIGAYLGASYFAPFANFFVDAAFAVGGVGVGSSGRAFPVAASYLNPITFTDSRINGGTLTEGWLQVNAFNTSATDHTIQFARLIFDDANTTRPGFASIPDVLTAWQVSAVPEPGSNLALLALGAGGLTLRRRLKRAA